MKMTKLEWRYLQKIALDHPYFDTHKLPLTEAEAKTVAAANNVLTGREFVDSVYRRLGMHRPIREKKRFDKMRCAAELLAVPPIRRIAIAVLAVLLMTVFFAATPTGRAIAESVIQYAVRLFDSGLSVSPTGSGNAKVTDLENTDHQLLQVYDAAKEDAGALPNAYADQTIRDFAETTGYRPLLLNGMTLKNTICDYGSTKSVMTFYEDEEGGKIVIKQEWNIDTECFFLSKGNMQCVEGREDLYAIIDNADGSVSYILLLNDSVVSVCADSRRQDDRLLSALLQYADKN